MLKDLSKSYSLLFSLCVYLALMPFAYIITSYVQDRYFPLEYWKTILFYDFFLTNLLFFLSFLLDNCSLIDFYWTVLPLAELYHAFYLKTLLNSQQTPSLFTAKSLLIAISTSLWGLRLTYNYIRSWPGFSFVDFRIAEVLEKLHFLGFSLLKWPVLYFEYFIFPGLFLFFAKNAVLHLALFGNPRVLDVWHFAGFFLMIFAVVYQTIADKQLFLHRTGAKSKEILDHGVWFYCRHPNYFGELTFWTGTFVLTHELFIDFLTIAWFFLGPAVMFLLFRFLTGPWMDRHLSRKRPEYREYMKKNTSLLLPWPRKLKQA